MLNTKILEDLGLTSAEIKTYLALLSLGSSTAGPIINKTTLQHSVVYRALHSLIEKGLINYITEGKRKNYQATEPDHLLEYIDEKREQLERILPALKQQESHNKETATIYKGVRGIREAFKIILNNQAKEYISFGGGPITVEIMGITFWLNMHTKRVAKKLPSRQIFDEAVRELGKDITNKPLTNVRFLPKEFAQYQETIIVGDLVAILVFSQTPYAFLIKDKHVAQGYMKYFELLWKLAK